MHTPKRILITFGRSFLALQLARQLSGVGHTVFVADSLRLHVSRFSNAVRKSYKVPAPRFSRQEYIHALIQIIKKEKIDLLIPIYEEISYIASSLDQFPDSCQVFAPPFPLFNELHNKWLFQKKLQHLGIETLGISLIKSPKDLQNLDFSSAYALKSCYSRASQRVIKVQSPHHLPSLPHDTHNPWVAQEWATGDRFCTYAVCHEGKVKAHSIYPVGFAIDGNSCLVFEAIDHPKILHWTQHFVGKSNFTGQIAFDFIETAEKKLYAIECNPRATSGLLLFSSEDRLDKALLNMDAKAVPQLITPKLKAKRQIAMGMLLYGWKKSALPQNNTSKFLSALFSTKDVIFSRWDMKPFLLEPLIFAGIVKTSRKYGVSIPDAFIHDHEWNGEPLRFN